ncbi:MAG: hypothetical protein FJ100_10665 [Deltaproteobacteria bacterium]|nr:hypothetical protein [Deltaproteobacteria bacterium]
MKKNCRSGKLRGTIVLHAHREGVGSGKRCCEPWQPWSVAGNLDFDTYIVRAKNREIDFNRNIAAVFSKGNANPVGVRVDWLQR